MHLSSEDWKEAIPLLGPRKVLMFELERLTGPPHQRSTPNPLAAPVKPPPPLAANDKDAAEASNSKGALGRAFTKLQIMHALLSTNNGMHSEFTLGDDNRSVSSVSSYEPLLSAMCPAYSPELDLTSACRCCCVCVCSESICSCGQAAVVAVGHMEPHS